MLSKASLYSRSFLQPTHIQRTYAKDTPQKPSTKPNTQQQKTTSQPARSTGNDEAPKKMNQTEVGAHFDNYHWRGKLFDMNDKQAIALKALYEKYREIRTDVKEFPFLTNIFREALASHEEPIRVAVTGASGQIGYALLYRIASGDMFGPRTPVILHLLELPQALSATNAVAMELRDCAFPSLHDVVVTDKVDVAFEGIDWALLVGASPRTPGMERGDLLLKNAQIFSEQGKALNKRAKGKDTRVVVVGNPANTNALIAQRNAPNIPAQNFSAMTRLDHNRGLAQLAEKTNTTVNNIDKFIIWGNHSATQFPDINHTVINKTPARELINDNKWVDDVFIPVVQQRGAAVLKARGLSSAASAASSLIDHVKDWYLGTNGRWTSMAVASNGEYGVEKGLIFSYPVTIDENGKWSVVNGLDLPADAQKRMDTTHQELKQERDGVAKLLP